MSDETHNGYADRETWHAALLINNDAAWQEETRELALTAYASAYAPDGGPVVELSSEMWQTYAVRVAGDALKDWADELAESVREGYATPDARMFVLEVGSAWRVDWPHVARSVLPEHNGYPHEPGYLDSCEACQSSCHCTPGHALCVFDGEHSGSGVEPVTTVADGRVAFRDSVTIATCDRCAFRSGLTECLCDHAHDCSDGAYAPECGAHGDESCKLAGLDY